MKMQEFFGNKTNAFMVQSHTCKYFIYFLKQFIYFNDIFFLNIYEYSKISANQVLLMYVLFCIHVPLTLKPNNHQKEMLCTLLGNAYSIYIVGGVNKNCKTGNWKLRIGFSFKYIIWHIYSLLDLTLTLNWSESYMK